MSRTVEQAKGFPRRALQRALQPVVLAVSLLVALAGCRREAGREASESADADSTRQAALLTTYFHKMKDLSITPIEPFRKLPTSLVLLPDERFVVPETQGLWLHVVGADGQGITRVGGESPVDLGLQGSSPGTFRSLSSVAVEHDGRLLAGDRTSNVVSVFSPTFEPESTFVLPETRAVWQLDALPEGRLVAAVAPRHPTAGGQLIILDPPHKPRALLPPDPLFRTNRWQAISAVRFEALPDGRLLAHSPPLPWAKVVESLASDSLSTPDSLSTGDSLSRLDSPSAAGAPTRATSPSPADSLFGKPSPLYRVAGSGPPDEASLEALSTWYASFTPLVNVEAAGPYIAFQYLAADTASADERAPGSTVRRSPSSSAQRPAPPRSGRGTFVNLYDVDGSRLAADIVLPAGHRILDTNDPARLYILTTASPRELVIQVWEPRSTTAKAADAR